MEFVRAARNPWGENVLLGLAWDVLWLVVAAGLIFVVVHAIFARKKEGRGAELQARDASFVASLPAKILRHTRSARISHWVLAVATFVLLITAFVPILGLQFPWVTIHWIAGVFFTAYIIYHIFDTVRRKTLGTMWIDGVEVREAMDRTRQFFQRTEDPETRPGKWGTENKVFHHITGLAGVAVAITGLLMMARVDTWFWNANPYFMALSDPLWGWIYVLHGLAAVGFVGLLIAHIYFAIRPDKLYLTRSMFKGWITRDEYLEHYNPERWRVDPEGREIRKPAGASGGASTTAAPATSSERAAPDETGN